MSKRFCEEDHVVFPPPMEFKWINPKELQDELDEINKIMLQIKQEMKALHTCCMFMQEWLERVSKKIDIRPPEYTNEP